MHEVAAYLLELAGPEMYSRNAFRLTGLATNADARAIRAQRQRLTTRAATGDEQAVAALAAIDELRDERHRLAHEIFRVWPGERQNSCGCPHSVHVTHTVAVRAHADALRHERSGTPRAADPLWDEAADAWRKLLRHAAFWDHLRYRIEQLGDRRMTGATVAEIREALPTALAKPIVALAVAARSPSRLVKRSAGWNFDSRAAANLLVEQAAPLRSGIEDVLRRATEDIDANRPGRAATALLDKAVPKVMQLNEFLPHGEHRSTAQIRDQIAILLNNSALALADNPAPAGVSLGLMFDTALGLVTSPSQRTLIESNAAAARQRDEIDADLAAFGFSLDNGGFAQLADLLTECLTSGRFDEAERILTVMRKHATDPMEQEQINALLSQLSRVSLTRGLGLGPSWLDDDAFRPSYQPVRVPEPVPVLRFMERTWQISLGTGWAVPIVIGTAFGFWWGALAGFIYVLGVLITFSRTRN
ncbi:MAG TPA: hypothetical protein VG247_21230 [Pseudonocardiaceae bacterium]|jgi:hypothetical protein|nr:hypothetical protein [Pseudonocardiaceae bacterium]